MSKLNEEKDCCRELKKPIKKENNLDETVSKILKKCGRFQYQSVAIISPIYIFLGMIIQAPVYLNFVPPHLCQNSAAMGNFTNFEGLNTTGIENNLYQCYRLKTTGPINNRSLSNYLLSNTSLAEEKCNSFVYNYTLGGNTVASEFNLVCDSAWKRPITVSVIMFGMLLSSTLGGQLSDRFGRKTTVFWAFTAHTFLELIMSFLPYYFLYVIFMFLLGLVHIVCYICTFGWTQELVQKGSKRTLTALVMNLSFSAGTTLVTLVAYSLRDWKWIYRCFAITSGLYIPILWCAPESPKWLIQTKNFTKAVKMLKRIARVNKTQVEGEWLKNPRLFLGEPEEITHKIQKHASSSLSLLLRNRILRTRIVTICILWNISFLGYYTLVLNTSNLGGDIYINNLVGGATDALSTIFMAAMANKFGRRNSFSFLIVMSGVSCLLSPSLKAVHISAGVASAMIGRFFVTSAMSLIILYTGELFPTLIRNTSIGVASMSARIGSIFSPFLIFFGEEFNLSIPFYVLGIACLTAPLLAFLLPETSKAILPDTIEDAVALENQRFRCQTKRIKQTQPNSEEQAENMLI